MKIAHLLTMAGIAALATTLSAGTLERSIPTTSDFARRLLTNETALQMKSAMLVGVSTNGGTVQSVDITVPAPFTVSGGPITGTGTLAVAASPQAANTVYAGPGTGSSSAPGFRVLTPADIPHSLSNMAIAGLTILGPTNTPYDIASLTNNLGPIGTIISNGWQVLIIKQNTGIAFSPDGTNVSAYIDMHDPSVASGELAAVAANIALAPISPNGFLQLGYALANGDQIVVEHDGDSTAGNNRPSKRLNLEESIWDGSANHYHDFALVAQPLSASASATKPRLRIDYGTSRTASGTEIIGMTTNLVEVQAVLGVKGDLIATNGIYGFGSFTFGTDPTLGSWFGTYNSVNHYFLLGGGGLDCDFIGKTSDGSQTYFRLGTFGNCFNYKGLTVGSTTPPSGANNFRVDTGVDADGGGIKHKRVSTGSIGAGASALVTITWGTAFGNANYTVTASVVDATASTTALRLVHIESVTASTCVVRVENTSGGSLTGTVNAIAIHD